MFNLIKKGNKIILVCIASFLLRLLLILKFKTYVSPNLWEYEEIANNLISGRGFLYHHLGKAPYRSFNNPLYSLLSLGVYLYTDHSYLAVLLLQSAFSMLCAYIIFKIGKIIFNEKVAFLSAILVAFHPGLIYYDIFNLIPLSIDIFFIAFVAFLFLRFKDKPNVNKMFLIGMIIGLGTLSRGIIVAILLALIIYIGIFFKDYFLGKKLSFISVLLVGTFLILSPWLIRNYIIHKELLLISTTGETFWRGNNERASGTSISGKGIPIFELYPEEFRNKVYSLDELGQKRFFENEAWQFIRNYPLKFIKFYFKKVYYFWWFSPQSGILYPKLYFVIYKYIYSILLIFSLWGLLSISRTKEDSVRRGTWVIIAVFLVISFSQSLFYVEGRHRWLIEPLLIPFFIYGILLCYDASKRFVT